MKLIKVKDGLLESDNFFLTSDFGDFVGSAKVSRDISTGKVKLISNERIERQFNYNEFVIEVKKENWDIISRNDFCVCYVGNNDSIYGIRDDISGNHNCWKIIAADGYIQVYSSDDNINWTNLGGSSIGDIIKQGFQKKSNNDFIFDEYKVYYNPYVTIQNFPENTICELYDSQDNLLKTRIFNADMECKVYLDNNNLSGYFVFKDVGGNILYTTDVINLGYGDVWVISPYNFEVLYLGNMVDNINSALLQDLSEMITIKNVNNIAYTDIVIGTKTNSNDLIQLSVDGITFTDTLTLAFAPDEEKQIYIKVTRNVDNHNFKVRDFQLVINE